MRVVWERDGEGWIEEAIARRWTKTAVYGTFDDDRLQINGVWVTSTDVQRR